MMHWLLNLLAPLFRRVRGRAQDRGDVRLLSDEPISDPARDYFGFAAFATALAEIIDNESTDTPLTIALSAPWGAGKTSVAGMMQSFLREWVSERDGDRPRIVCWFNAWEHDDAPHLGAALAAKVARTASSRRRLWWRVIQPLPAAMLGPQERWRRIVVMVIAAVMAAFFLTVVDTTRKFAEQVFHLNETLIGGLGWFGLLWIGALLWRGIFSAARDAARFVDDPRSEASRGSMAQVKQQLGRLMGQATRGGRMVIFVDDLERCHAERAVEVFEVASQLLAHRGVVTVLLADMRAMSRAAQTAYAGDGVVELDLGRRYLEKLVQLELELPPPSGKDMKRLLRGDVLKAVPADRGRTQSKLSSGPTVMWQVVQSWALMATVLSAVFALIFFFSSGPKPSTAVTWLGAVTAIGGIVGAVVALIASLWRIQARRRRREVEQNVTDALSDLPDSRSGLFAPDDPGWREVVGDEKLDSFADKVVESIRTVHSQEIEEVEGFIRRYPPRFPRGAKRMLNHARLLTKIARERSMFGGAPELTPAHLGKWIVLRERWPQLAEQITARHSALEKDGKLSESSILRLATDSDKRDRELERLLAEPPELATVVERLIYFQPAAGD